MRWHAGLIESPAGEISLAAALDEQPLQVDDFMTARHDFVDTLSRLNQDLNGDVPSETVGGLDVPRNVAYAVAEIARLLRERQPAEPVVAEFAWELDVAWAAVLSGDIDDLAEHLHEERQVRDARKSPPHGDNSF